MQNSSDGFGGGGGSEGFYRLQRPQPSASQQRGDTTGSFGFATPTNPPGTGLYPSTHKPDGPRQRPVHSSAGERGYSHGHGFSRGDPLASPQLAASDPCHLQQRLRREQHESYREQERERDRESTRRGHEQTRGDAGLGFSDARVRQSQRDPASAFGQENTTPASSPSPNSFFGSTARSSNSSNDMNPNECYQQSFGLGGGADLGSGLGRSSEEKHTCGRTGTGFGSSVGQPSSISSGNNTHGVDFGRSGGFGTGSQRPREPERDGDRRQRSNAFEAFGSGAGHGQRSGFGTIADRWDRSSNGGGFGPASGSRGAAANSRSQYGGAARTGNQSMRPNARSFGSRVDRSTGLGFGPGAAASSRARGFDFRSFQSPNSQPRSRPAAPYSFSSSKSSYSFRPQSRSESQLHSSQSQQNNSGGGNDNGHDFSCRIPPRQQHLEPRLTCNDCNNFEYFACCRYAHLSSDMHRSNTAAWHCKDCDRTMLAREREAHIRTRTHEMNQQRFLDAIMRPTGGSGGRQQRSSGGGGGYGRARRGRGNRMMDDDDSDEDIDNERARLMQCGW